ncbi:hypothetical protein E2320_022052 [Naja naja]|nr:hypothetical protein E2320_022052 [Naja naja]
MEKILEHLPAWRIWMQSRHPSRAHRMTGGECRPKVRNPKAKGERKKKQQLPLHLLLPPLLLPQPYLPKDEKLQPSPPAEERPVEAKHLAEDSQLPMPDLSALSSESAAEEDESKQRPIIPMLYVVPQCKKAPAEKKRLTCQEVFERFVKKDQMAPLELDRKDDDSVKAESCRLLLRVFRSVDRFEPVLKVGFSGTAPQPCSSEMQLWTQLHV